MKPTVEERNRLIKIPKQLITDDGRVLRIRHWKPETGIYVATTVTLTAVIELLEQPADADGDPIDVREMR